jgi:hypothetical protein
MAAPSQDSVKKAIISEIEENIQHMSNSKNFYVAVSTTYG